MTGRGVTVATLQGAAALLPALVLCACSLTLGTNPQQSGFCSGDLLNSALGVAPGYYHTCAFLLSSTSRAKVKCWGSNEYGQLGDGTNVRHAAPVELTGLTDLQVADLYYMSAGGYHTCAMFGSGGVYCWGRNDAGQLGDGTMQDSAVPVQVPGLGGVIFVSAGLYHTCAVTNSGNVYCWGRNDNGQLGDGTTTSSPVPIQVPGVVLADPYSAYVSVFAGGYHSCAVAQTSTISNGLKCWGRNDFGQLGDGSTVDRNAPVEVQGLEDPALYGVNYVVGGEYHTCVLTGANSVKCWGRNDRGQLGDGSTVNSSTPVDAFLGIAYEIYSGAHHACIFDDVGMIYCWGSNEYGQLGAAVSGSSPTPVLVQAVSQVYYSQLGGYHSCSLTFAGGLYYGITCWGRNDSGQLGNGTMESPGLTPPGVLCR